MKECTKCKLSKPVGEFNKRSRSPDGLTARCAECLREGLRQYRKDQPERVAETAKTYREANPEKIRSKKKRERERHGEEINAKTRAWRAENREHVKDFDLRRKFGITLDQYHSLLKFQGGGCAGCGTTECQTGNALAVDHDHAHCPTKGKGCPECIRGLLCMNCNMTDALAGKPAVIWGEVLREDHPEDA